MKNRTNDAVNESGLCHLNQFEVASEDDSDMSCWNTGDLRKCRLRCWEKGDMFQKQRVIYTLCIYAAFTIVGWMGGLFGPSLLELQQISNVGLEKGSWIVTTLYIGYALGSLGGGILYDKGNRKLLFGGSLLVLAVVLVVTPWCVLYWAMVTVHFVNGVCQGVIDTAGNAEILTLWKNSRMIYFGVDLIYGVGSFIAPLITAPFLSGGSQGNSVSQNESATNETSTPMWTELTNVSSVFNISSGPGTTLSFAEESQLYIPYTFTAVLILIVALSFFIVFFNYDRKSTVDIDRPGPSKNESDGLESRPLPTRLRIGAIVLISAILFIFVALNHAFSSYLTLYCVEFLSWSPANGAVITSVFNGIGMLATTIALFLRCVNTMALAGVHCFTLAIALVGILLSSTNSSDIGIWISVTVFGYFKAVLFSLLYTWTNEFLTPVTGKLSSLYLLTAMVGSSVNPILLGYLMEHFTRLWFCYLFIIEGVIIIILYLLAVFLTRFIISKYGKTYFKSEKAI